MWSTHFAGWNVMNTLPVELVTPISQPSSSHLWSSAPLRHFSMQIARDEQQEKIPFCPTNDYPEVLLRNIKLTKMQLGQPSPLPILFPTGTENNFSRRYISFSVSLQCHLPPPNSFCSYISPPKKFLKISLCPLFPK